MPMIWLVNRTFNICPVLSLCDLLFLACDKNEVMAINKPRFNSLVYCLALIQYKNKLSSDPILLIMSETNMGIDLLNKIKKNALIG